MKTQKQQHSYSTQTPITHFFDLTERERTSCRESMDFSSFSQNPTLHLVVRDSSRMSVRQSIDFDEIQHYQKEIAVSGSILQDFNSIRQSYRQSNCWVESKQNENQSKFQNSQSYQVQLQKQQPSTQLSLKSQSSTTTVQQIRNQKQQNSNQIPLTILLILANKEQIQSVWVVDKKGKQIKLKVAKRNVLKHNLVLSFFSINKSQLQNYKIKYNVIKSNIFFFSKTTTDTLDFSKMIIDQQAGLLCEEIANQKSDQLINTCIIYGHQYLVKYVQHLQKADLTIFKLYYKIFKKHFRAYSDKIGLVFSSVSIDDSKYIYSEFFLYFIFIIYREGALQVLREHNLYQKLMFNRQSLSRILCKQRFNYYENGQYLKQFIVYAMFCYSQTVFQQNPYSYANISKLCIIQSSPLYNKAIFNKLNRAENKEVINKLLDNKNVNNRFISNQEISFIQYLDVMVSYCQSKIKLLRQQKVEQITSVFLGFLVKLNSKLQITKLNKEQEQSLSQYQVPIISLFKSKSGGFNLQIKKLGQIYIEVKGLYQFAPKMGQILLKNLKEFIFRNCPALLKYFFHSIIYPLVIFPEIAEQNVILIEYFMKEKIESENVFTLMKIAIESNKIINYMTIQFILKKFMKQNPFISDFSYQQLRDKIEDWLSTLKISRDRKDFLSKLIEVLQPRKDSFLDKQGFGCCMKEMKNILCL